MQLRRVLLLFALVLGLSAVVAALAPTPEPRDEARDEVPTAPAPRAEPPSMAARTIALTVPPAGQGRAEPRTYWAVAESRLAVKVSVPEPGDVLIEDLGLRESADPLDPARLDLLARPAGTHTVSFVPVRGPAREVARIEFERPATVRPQPRGR